MTQRSVFMVQMLDRLGAPLLSAVAANENGQVKEAERLAELLARSVQISIGLADKMGVRGANDADADAVRLAVAGLAAGLVAGHYRASGKAPDENDIGRLTGALEAVLVFADNFIPAAENTMRLQGLTPGLYPADETQIVIQYVQALVPVVNAIARFSFGQPEKKLVQDVSGRLMEQATAMREQLIGPTDLKPARQAELGLLRALAQIYVGSHDAAMERLKAAGPDAAPSIDVVWAEFSTRVEMITAMGLAALPVDGGGSGGVQPQPQAVPQTAQPAQPAAQPVQSPPEAPPSAAEQKPESPASPEGPVNPMSFFKPGAKKASDDSGKQD